MNILKYWFGWSNRMASYDKTLAEINRQQARIKPAYELHRMVLEQYGLEAYTKLADPETIIEGDLSINVVNYLDI